MTILAVFVGIFGHFIFWVTGELMGNTGIEWRLEVEKYFSGDECRDSIKKCS